MALPWSAPSYEQGVTPAIASSRYEVSAPNISGVLSAILSDRERKQAQTQQSISDVAKAVSGIMNQRRQDQMAQAMLDQASNYDNESPSQSEAMARTLNESRLHPTDAWTAFTQGKAAQFKDAAASIQQQKLDLMAEKLSQHGLVDVTLPNGQTVKVPAAEAFKYYYEPGPTSTAHDKWKDAVPVARGKLDDTGAFTNAYPEAASGDYIKLQPPTGKPLVIPFDEYQKRTGGAAAPPREAAATPPQSAVDYLKAHPELSDQFDAKYGAGAAARYLQ